MNRLLAAFAVLSACCFASACKSSVEASANPDYQMSYSVGDVTFDMTEIPAGFFSMGLVPYNRYKVKDSYVREVALDGFVISGPVTNALWKAVTGKELPGKPEAPATKVSWQEVEKFISKLNKMTGKVFMLPDEAQWEYAASLSDMEKSLGKRSEWCLDSYLETAELEKKEKEMSVGGLLLNPVPERKGDNKVVRNCREKSFLEAHTRSASVGFRLVQPTGKQFAEDVYASLTGSASVRSEEERKSEKISVNGVSFDMVKVSGGTFRIGFTDNDVPPGAFSVPDNEKNAHDVTLDDFEIGKTEVTVGLWNAVMGSVPYLNDPEDSDKPVGNVSWFDSKKFLEKLNALTGKKFRLPTEAEWEYAARGGNASRHCLFSGSDDARTAMWFVDNAKMKRNDVAGRKANELGIYDMSGNVWEWCNDYGADYVAGAAVNPEGPSEGTMRVMRGGSCASKWQACRIPNRSFVPPVSVKETFGLRLAI